MFRKIQYADCTASEIVSVKSMAWLYGGINAGIQIFLSLLLAFLSIAFGIEFNINPGVALAIAFIASIIPARIILSRFRKKYGRLFARSKLRRIAFFGSCVTVLFLLPGFAFSIVEMANMNIKLIFIFSIVVIFLAPIIQYLISDVAFNLSIKIDNAKLKKV